MEVSTDTTATGAGLDGATVGASGGGADTDGGGAEEAVPEEEEGDCGGAKCAAQRCEKHERRDGSYPAGES